MPLVPTYSFQPITLRVEFELSTAPPVLKKRSLHE
jgi:hypothetical protein